MIKNVVSLVASAALALILFSSDVQPVNALATGNHARVARHVASANKPGMRRRQSGTCRARDESATSEYQWTSSATDQPTSTSTKQSWVASVTSAASGAISTAVKGKGHSYDSPCAVKAGIAWNMGETNADALASWASGGSRCFYTWSSWPNDAATKAGLNVLPMLHNNRPETITEFHTNMAKYDPTTILAFNEPNEVGQSNMDPWAAAQSWKDNLEQYAQQGFKIASPACSSAASGKQWMKDFLDACKDCSISYIALHWYGTKADDFIAYVEDYIETFGLPVMVTEYAAQDFSGQNRQLDDGGVWQFLKTTVDYLEGNSQVVAYFAFGTLADMAGVSESDRLLDAATYQPNALGSAYLKHFS
ncbi:glycoside hydrolase family 128 protein [Cylindrobasidium torrendii FP15055 ss-10]|uniref:Glycoside hydrolase family 128 protein n=1 Tax=Cylindrobasidium torrendii FP15055 ss-10 TaxID=1314674 RepID=A0A0D7BQV4_9AGAR|nr:glycoside hydrolase family 128 protein [Cylindrobasidium torrendii FP15055 ss-10]